MPNRIVENNWMVRQLSNARDGQLNDAHLHTAMEVIRTKFLVGLLSRMEESMERFEKFFDFKYRVRPPEQEKCRKALMDGGSNQNKQGSGSSGGGGSTKIKPKEGGMAWEKLLWQNQYDMQLYEYIETLFEEHASLVADMPNGYRNIGASCCKCGGGKLPEGFICPQSIYN